MLPAELAASDASIAIDASGFTELTRPDVRLRVGDEVMRVASVSGTEIALLRGLDGTSVSSHVPVRGGGSCACSDAGVPSGTPDTPPCGCTVLEAFRVTATRHTKPGSGVQYDASPPEGSDPRPDTPQAPRPAARAASCRRRGERGCLRCADAPLPRCARDRHRCFRFSCSLSLIVSFSPRCATGAGNERLWCNPLQRAFPLGIRAYQSLPLLPGNDASRWCRPTPPRICERTSAKRSLCDSFVRTKRPPPPARFSSPSPPPRSGAWALTGVERRRLSPCAGQGGTTTCPLGTAACACAAPGLLPGTDLSLPLEAGVVPPLAPHGDPASYPTVFMTTIREDVTAAQTALPVLAAAGLLGKHVRVDSEILRRAPPASRLPRGPAALSASARRTRQDSGCLAAPLEPSLQDSGEPSGALVDLKNAFSM
jgi:hypothetical protein